MPPFLQACDLLYLETRYHSLPRLASPMRPTVLACAEQNEMSLVDPRHWITPRLKCHDALYSMKWTSSLFPISLGKLGRHVIRIV